MSFPPPPGLQQQPSRPSSAQPSSLPPRPPQSSYSAPGVSPYQNAASDAGSKKSGGYSAFTAFQPRSVAASKPFRPHSPAVSAAGGGGYNSGYQQPQPPPQYYPQPYQQQSTYYGQQQYGNYGAASQYGQGASTTQYPSGGGRGYNRTGDPPVDPETEAQIAQWQSAYMTRETEAAAPGKSATGANAGPLGNVQRATDSATPTSAIPSTTSTPTPSDAPSKTVIRSGGGQKWTDSTLLEWDPAHFRLFAGNLAGEVTDDSLLKAFSIYPSVQKARVIRDKRTEKSKGYGFVSFADGEDFFRAAREMQGKYIGSHPVLLKRATTEIRPVSAKAGGKGGKGGKKGAFGGGGGGGGAGKGAGSGGGKTEHGGVQKNKDKGKTKGGLKVLG